MINAAKTYYVGLINRHIANVHEGDRLFVCNLCNAKFSEKSNMNKTKDQLWPITRPRIK